MPQLRTSKQIRNSRVIYDVLYGFVPITEWEEKIINSPFFQRLRWIKQLGFANYIFPGAEHNRFAHVIGVMHSMHQMLTSLGLAVPDSALHDPKLRTPDVQFHRSLRIAALLHDIGTFPFSHAIDNAYIRHGNDLRGASRRAAGMPMGAGAGKTKKPKDLPNSHEHLGSFIIKNTDYDGGITQILNEYGLDVSLISKIIKGDSPYLIANQLMHSDLDADRMDYLMRDSHYTGIKYGQFDREYILANLVTYDAGSDEHGEQLGFGVEENALHAVEDFLIARFSWYSQVVRSQGSAKFDIMASCIAESFLEHDLMHQFQDLLDMIKKRDRRFFWWNDVYFLTRCQEILHEGKLKDRRVMELTEMLLFRKAPKTIKHPLFEHRILTSDGSDSEKQKLMKQVGSLVAEMERAIEKHGTGKEWILADIPQKDIVFTRGLGHVVKKRKSDNLYLERDPVKIVSKSGKPQLLVERDNTLMKQLSSYVNFVPTVYGNDKAVALLRARKLIP